MSKEIRVGLLAIVSMMLLYFGFNFLKGIDFLSPTHRYVALYSKIGGLQVSNPVIVNGFSVGRVSNISILQQEENKLYVEIDVDKNLKLGVGTKAHLTNNDFFGSKAIVLEIEEDSKLHQSGDTLISVIDKGLEEIFDNAVPVVDNIGTTIKKLNEILEGFSGIGGKLDTLSNDVHTTFTKLDRTLNTLNNDLPEILDGLKTAQAKAATLITRLTENTDETFEKLNSLEVEKLVNSLNSSISTVDSLLTQINAGQGSIGKLVREDSLYNNLNQALVDLDKVLVHFEDDPRYFLAPLGKKKKKRK